MPSVAIPHLYRSLHAYLLQRIPDDCDTRLANLIFLMMGLFQSRSVQLTLVARKTPIRAKKLSIVKRLSRLTLAVCLLYLWLIALAEHVITQQLTDEIDRTDRRDLSLFRLGWDFLERRLALFDPIPPVSVPNFCLMSGG